MADTKRTPKHAKHAGVNKTRAEVAHDRARGIQQALSREDVVFAKSESPMGTSNADFFHEDFSAAFDDAVPFNEALPADFKDEFQDFVFDDEIGQDAQGGAEKPDAGNADDAFVPEELDEAASTGEMDAIPAAGAAATGAALMGSDSNPHAAARGLAYDTGAQPQMTQTDDSADYYEDYNKRNNRKKVIAIVAVVVVVLVVVAVIACFALGVFGGKKATNTNTTLNENVSANVNSNANTNTNANANANANANVNANANTNTATKATYSFTKNVPEVFQYPTFYGGCEVVALEMFLKSFGYDVTGSQLADNYLEYGDSFVTSYTGSPYELGAGFPPALVKCATSYLTSVNSPYKVLGFKDEPFSFVESYVSRGIPVVAWTTMSLAEPEFTGIEEDGYQWYSNEHNSVICSIDNDYVYYMDPENGYVRSDRTKFENVYNACGGMGYTMDL